MYKTSRLVRISLLIRASDRSWKKKSNFAVFFRDKFAEKSDDFAGISLEFSG